MNRCFTMMTEGEHFLVQYSKVIDRKSGPEELLYFYRVIWKNMSNDS